MKKIYFVFFLVLLLCTGLIWYGCEQETGIVAPDEETPQVAKPAPGAIGLERAMAVQDEHSPGLMAIPDVVGTATGLGADGRPAVVVLTRVAGVAGIPRSLAGVPVLVKVTGEIRALIEVTNTNPGKFDRPVPIGVSTGHPNITAGTIGARVIDVEGNVYALSNNHVYADENKATIGDNVLQPGTYDGGIDPDDAIGTLFDFEPIVFHPRARNEIDAAIALSSKDYLGTATPEGGYGTPNSTIVVAVLGQQVQKFGRTTELTKGEITGVNATVRISYSSGKAMFVNQIIIEGDVVSFSEGGDSGSLVVTNDSDCNPVGLLFAGSVSVTIANRIDLVLGRFKVSIDGEEGSEPVNTPPTADFSFTTSGLTVDFTDASTDDDGNVTNWNWEFGDGASSIEQNPSHTYIESGTYTVILTVTDNDDATDFKSTDVTLTEQGTAPPVVDVCTPDNGNTGDRLTVEVHGSNFLDGATVDFGGEGIVVQTVSFVGPSQLNVKINIQRKATSGSRVVTVTNTDGQIGTLTAGFTVN